MSPLEHPIEIDAREDADAFYAFPEMLFFVAVSRVLRKSAKRRKPAAGSQAMQAPAKGSLLRP